MWSTCLYGIGNEKLKIRLEIENAKLWKKADLTTDKCF